MNSIKTNIIHSILTVILLSTLTTALAELPYSVLRRVDKIEPMLNSIEQLIVNNKKQAVTTLTEVKKEMDYIYQYYDDKFDNQDEGIVKIKQQISEFDKQLLVNGKVKTDRIKTTQSKSRPVSFTSNKNLETLLPVLTNYRQQFSPQMQQVQQDLLTLSSSVQANDLTKINNAIVSASNSINLLNTTLIPLSGLIEQLSHKYPDLQKVMTQGQIGADVSQLIRNLDENIKSWDQQRFRQAKKWLQESDEALTQTAMVMAQVKQMPADVRAPMVNQFIALLKAPKILVQMIPAIYPKLQVGMHQYNAEINNLISKAQKSKDKYTATEKQMSELSKSAAIEIKKHLEANRFPNGLSHNEKDEREITVAYLQAFSVDKLLRIGISKDWYEKTEAHWVNDILMLNTYKYINVWIAHKTSSGRIRAYNTTFRKIQNGDGSWSALAYWSVGTSYLILNKNINLS